MANSEFIQCPFCNRSCKATADACSCGYVFNQKKYQEKESAELKDAERDYEDSLFSIGGLGAKFGLPGGILVMILGAAIFILSLLGGKFYPYSLILFIAGLLAAMKGIKRLFRK